MEKQTTSQRMALPERGALVELELEDLSSRGQGVGRTSEGLVVMVTGGVPGERVSARVVRLHNNRVDAEVVSILRPAPERVTPRCAHFGSCGGCSLQILDPAAQRMWKTRRLRHLLTRQGRLIDVPVEEAQEVGPAYGYRGRMAFTGEFTAGSLVLGLHDREGKLFSVAECHLPDPGIMEAFAAIRQALQEEPPTASKTLSFRLDLRRATVDGRILATINWQESPPDALLRQIDLLPVTVPGLTVVQRGPGGIRRRSGDSGLMEMLAGLEVPLDARVFVQTHPAGASRMYEEAMAWLAPAAPGLFLDLYAGVALLARAALKDFEEAVAVESAPAAVRLGRKTAGANSRVTFLEEEARTAVARLSGDGAQFAAAAVNPPRSGMHTSLPPLLNQLGIRRIAYISCHPATLARDLARLDKAGFRTAAIQPFDLFPQTAEVEVLARLEARDPGQPVDAGERPL
jgi:23S rRNA (uracil1939-C5)-methyltransferase